MQYLLVNSIPCIKYESTNDPSINAKKREKVKSSGKLKNLKLRGIKVTNYL